MEYKPAIRFKGFTDDWEVRKLGEVFEHTTNYINPKESNIELWSLTVQDGLTKKTERYNREFLTKKEDKFKEVKNGEIVYNPMNMTLGAIGFNDFGRSVAVSGYYVTMHSKMNIDPYFIHTWMKSPNAIQLYKNKATGTLIEKQRVQYPTFSSITYPFPSFDEQEKIGLYFKKIDNLIILHQRKCEETKQLKKFLLQKMFPKDGQTVPEIRFKGFNDDWEIRRFSDFTFFAGKKNKDNLPLKPYAITNDKGFVLQNIAHDEFGYMKNTDRTLYNIVPPNTFAYNPARINVGSIGYYEGTENVIVSSLYEVFKTVSYVYDRFLWHWFKSSEFPRLIEKFQEGSVRLYFYYDKLCECKMMMPSVEEQIKIARILDNLDNLITLHQRKCDELKELKRYLLKNMFPQSE